MEKPQLRAEEVPRSTQSQRNPQELSTSKENPPAAVDDDIFRHDPLLQHPHFWVLPTATEEPRRFSFEVPNFLPVPIQDAISIFLLDFICLLLQLLKPGHTTHTHKKKKSEWFGLERIFNIPTKKSECRHSLGKVQILWTGKDSKISSKDDCKAMECTGAADEIQEDGD